MDDPVEFLKIATQKKTLLNVSLFYFSVSVSHYCISLFSDLIGCFFIAWFDILGRMCRTVACKEHTPSTVSLVSVLEIPFTYGWGWLWSGQAMGKLEVGVFLLHPMRLWLEIVWNRRRRTICLFAFSLQSLTLSDALRWCARSFTHFHTHGFSMGHYVT